MRPRRAPRPAQFALKIAAKHYTHEEFRALERDLEADRIDVRLYYDGLILMRVEN